MRILHLSPDPPTTSHGNGGTTRQYHLYKRLIALGHEVVVAGPFAAELEGEIELLRAEGFEVCPVVRPTSRLREVLVALVRRPSLITAPFRLSLNGFVGAVYWATLGPVAREALADPRLDVVNIEQEFAAQWLGDLDTELPTVLTSHQVESAYRFDRARRMKRPARWLATLDARRSARSERRWTPQFSAVVCMSPEELALLAETVPELPPSYAIGNGADLAWLRDLAPDPAEERILLTGTMAFEPNAIAAEFLAREVMPLVRERLPGATLDIVGRDPSEQTRQLGRLEGVTVHGSVPDMRPWFAQASVCTLPMLEGGGTRLKLAEAFAARRAVVSTTNGATGVAVTDGHELVIADGAPAFAQAILELLADDARRAELADNGHRFGELNLNWERLGDRWAQALAEVIARHEG